MHPLLRYFILTFCVVLTVSCASTNNFKLPKSEKDVKEQTIISKSIHINKERGLNFIGTENLFFVREQRNNQSSRKIAIHYFRFPAKEKTNLAPLFYLPGGPGGYFSEDHFYQQKKGPSAKAWTTEISIYNQKRDVIILNQRGNSNAPGDSFSNFRYRTFIGSPEQPMDLTALADRQYKSILQSVEDLRSEGIDLSGYDIINIVDDIEEIRSFYNYKKIALVGSSFGSQWALGYIQRYPENVDRALLSAIEPLDHSLDDPKFVWNMFKRLSEYAESDKHIKPYLPEVGLIEAIKVILTRLENQPVSISLTLPGDIEQSEIILGADDFRASLEFPFAVNQRASFESWPKYITELYRGDYNVLALWALQKRKGQITQLLIAPLMDNSLGISEERSLELEFREEIKWTGDFNYLDKLLRTAALTQDVGDSFRKPVRHNIPVLMLHGELDRNTPLENAYYQLQYLSKGYLAIIKSGSHSAKRELTFQHPELAKKIFEFMNVDFETQSFSDYTNTLPDEVELRSLNFIKITGDSLFEMITKEK